MLLLEFDAILRKHGYYDGREAHALLVAKWMRRRLSLRNLRNNIGHDIFGRKKHNRRKCRKKYKTIMRWNQGELDFVCAVLEKVGE